MSHFNTLQNFILKLSYLSGDNQLNKMNFQPLSADLIRFIPPQLEEMLMI